MIEIFLFCICKVAKILQNLLMNILTDCYHSKHKINVDYLFFFSSITFVMARLPHVIGRSSRG